MKTIENQKRGEKTELFIFVQDRAKTHAHWHALPKLEQPALVVQPHNGHKQT
jgi:hypothetical protein